MLQNNILKKLEKHQLRKTNMRKEVLKLFLEAESKALSHRDIEQALGQPDRITLYRTLKTFEEKGLIHQAVDSSGISKYALCSDECTSNDHQHEHAHFHCNNCGATICLDENIIPQAEVPEGYTVTQSHLILEGVCADCAQAPSAQIK
jgi:Fur family ferric uptake transcriptional regulator